MNAYANRICLIGKPLGHSYSPVLHALLGSYPYELVELEEAEIGTFLRSDAFSALNVTIPYKKTVLPFLDEISPEAARIGAVNTITRLPGGGLRGDNTDYFGLVFCLRRAGISLQNKHVFIIGSGGASVTAQTVAQDSGACSVQVLPHRENTPENWPRFAAAEILINASPVGMYPHNGETPLSLDAFPHISGVMDMVYNPSRTALLLDAEERGIRCTSGLPMLAAQAKKAAELFSGHALSDALLEPIIRKIRLDRQNITLIGMPGCGKTTVGQALAQRTGRPFADLDAVFAEKAGMSAADFLRSHGEEAFRQLETACLEPLSASAGMVLAMGGGTPIRAENRRLIRQNSTVVYLRRPVSSLPVDGRPLSQAGSLQALYEARRAFYEQTADVMVEAAASPDATACAVLEVLGL